MRKSAFSTLTASLFFLSSPAWAQTPLNACDLATPYGVIDSSDVQAAINMTLTPASCTANIAGANVCNVLVVQRVINASLGQGCLTSTGIHMVALTWTASSGATSYQVYRGTTSGSYTLLGTATSTSYNDYTVVSGTTYYYAVKAVNGSNVSDYSTPVPAAIPTP